MLSLSTDPHIQTPPLQPARVRALKFPALPVCVCVCACVPRRPATAEINLPNHNTTVPVGYRNNWHSSSTTTTTLEASDHD